MKNRLFAVWALTLLCAFNSQLSTAHAQGTAFTYAGQLNNNNALANGWYDFQFALFDAAAGGNLIGSALTTNAVAVSNGLFTVTLDFGAGVFPGADRWLNLSVKTNGAASFTPLTPRQQIMSTPYAITAGNVTGPINGSAIVNGSIAGSKLANGAVGASQLASNSITASQLAPGAAAANLGTNSSGGIPSGGLILSPFDNAALVAAGYVKIGTTQLGDGWSRGNNGDAPTARYFHTAVWTGSEMIVWGGFDGRDLADGGRYNPAGNSWKSISNTGAPAVREGHTAVWTGSEMIIWGGNNVSYLNDGGRYNPAGDIWTTLTTTGAPAAREFHTAVWTGDEMLVWGGNNRSALNDGGRYNPAGNSWTAMTTTAVSGAPVARFYHTAVWTGSEMIIWGGYGGGNLNTGARYNPAGDSWTTVTSTNAPAARYNHTAVWTGSKMVVWGGRGGGYWYDGGRYNPAANSWTAVNTIGGPTARSSHTAVWTGSEMIVWGGLDAG